MGDRRQQSSNKSSNVKIFTLLDKGFKFANLCRNACLFKETYRFTFFAYLTGQECQTKSK